MDVTTMARNLLSEDKVRQVRKDGVIWEFGIMHEPAVDATVTEINMVFPARTECYARKHTAQGWVTVRRFFL